MEEILEEIGLNKTESKVYYALAEIGSATISEIAKRTKSHRSNIYDATIE